MKTVKYQEYSDELRRVKRELGIGMGTKRSIELYEIGGCFNAPVKLGVNWAALGTVSGEEARRYAELLMKAAQATENFKYNGYKVVYGE